ncbi:MAG: hypothetical protein KDD42_04625, partial [Bdellovibrionales bacterium]|nr:hypothetical protein [Bdellovibrionales bacterium]
LGLLRGANSEQQAELRLVQAKLLLSLGDVTGAEKILAELKDEGLAERAVIAVIRGKSEEAIELAKQAEVVRADFQSAIANSLVAQSQFNLELARKWLKLAIERNPAEPFGYARLAEIQLGFGNIEEAERLIVEAQKLGKADPYLHAVAGFAALSRDNPGEAQKRFRSALDMVADLGIAHLGLGLAIIRQGDLLKGRQELERAAFLEPRTALFRSYLGKAYYEEEREDLAQKEYDHAIELDSEDPTPYLYRAYNNLSNNRVVAALQDVEESIEKNDARAAFRSRFLMDQDLGVRSAGLAEVFTALGFDQAARIEAIKAINSDYSNYSAHRMLGDSYNSILTNDAGISETQIANLLAPLSFNLFRQPSGEAAINEYNSLFERDQNRAEIRASASSQDDELLPNVSFSGKDREFGYFLGYDGAFTDGSRRNNYFHRNRLSAAFQYQPTFEDRMVLSTEVLWLDQENDHQETEEIGFDEYHVALGYNRRIDAGTKFLAQIAFSNQRNDYLDLMGIRDVVLEEISGLDFLEDQDSLLVNEFARERIKSARGSAQLVHDSESFSMIFGTQIYYSDVEREEDSSVLDDSYYIFPDIGYHLRSAGYNDLNSYDVYLYSSWHLAKWIDLNLGANYTELDLEEREITPYLSEDFGRSRVNPKLGVTLYPNDSTTVRAAYFETMRKSSLEDSGSIEPTLVGGINQRFTDLSGARARNLGLGLDHKWPGSTYIGAEWIHRDLIDDLRSAESTILLDYDAFQISSRHDLLESGENHQDQDFFSAYLYQVLAQSLVASVDYQWSGLERTDPELLQDIELNKLRTGLRYFDSDGWFTFVSGTWRDQSRQGGDFLEDGSSDFWIFDAGLGYRLPERHGSVVLELNNLLDQDFEYDQSLGVEEFLRSDFGARIIAAVNF